MGTILELSPRLRMVAELVPAGARLADVGTDHGYLPAALIQAGKIPSAIAADLRQGPLSRAKATVAEYGLGEHIAFRLCDGLRGLAPEETDCVSIAGMGGETIAHILNDAPWTRARGTPLVLQPMTSFYDLRLWLTEHGYTIRRECLVREGETLYTAWLAQAGEGESYTPAELWAGKNTPDPLRGEWLDLWRRKVNRALEGLAKAQQTGAAERIRHLTQVRDGLDEMKGEWNAWQR